MSHLTVLEDELKQRVANPHHLGSYSRDVTVAHARLMGNLLKPGLLVKPSAVPGDSISPTLTGTPYYPPLALTEYFPYQNTLGMKVAALCFPFWDTHANLLEQVYYNLSNCPEDLYGSPLSAIVWRKGCYPVFYFRQELDMSDPQAAALIAGTLAFLIDHFRIEDTRAFSHAVIDIANVTISLHCQGLKPMVDQFL